MNEIAAISEPVLLIDDLFGINIPKKFYEDFDFDVWGLDQEEFTDLKNTESPEYWDTWDELLEAARNRHSSGLVFRLYMHEGALWAIPDDFDEEDFLKHFP